ncbi:hypothetical protein ACIQYS_14480 [Psychrobacillus sp. NPDC096426]|uniref:hypothetical protein n=1 Tax=Psychrobacillus sp. NPDC096426 TaxID=3364491 RepID=UPI0037FB03E8
MGNMKCGRILVDGHIIPVAFSLNTPKIYKKAFKSDFWSDLAFESNRTEETYNISETNRRALQVVWSYAKTADSKIQRLDRWAKQFNNVTGVFMVKQLENFLMNEG